MHKLSWLSGTEWVEHSFAPVYELANIDTPNPRIIVGVPAGDPVVFEQLALLLEPPYFVLYVLHTPRGEEQAGRYQSPELSAEEFRAFITRFAQLLSQDSRFDIWAYSPAERATVVWDRHNQLFCYGPIERFASRLQALGFRSGDPSISVPHQHHYRQECDAQAAELLAALDWSFSPLQPEDEQ